MEALPPQSVTPSRPWRLPRLLDRWSLGVIAIALLVASPVVAVVGLAFSPTDDIWWHLVSTVLPKYVLTTLLLSLGVALGVLVTGVGTAWLVTMCRFPGRRLFEWALLLPLAVPAYLAAYVYTDLLEFSGPVQGALRAVFGWETRQDYWFPEVRSLGGAITFLTLVLYPYVYMLSRVAFTGQSVGALEVGRSLGRGPWATFFTVALPLARPAIVVGLLLAMMETLNDFGTVDYFAVQTFTVGIFRVWFGMNNASGAAQLATLLLAFVLLLVWGERAARSRQRYHNTTTRHQRLPDYRLAGWQAALAFLACLTPVMLGFAVPTGMLLANTLQTYTTLVQGEFLTTVGNSLLVSSLAAGVCIVLGLFMAYGVRLRPSALVRGASRLAAVGYAVPGTVLAVGVMIPATRLDNTLDAYMRATFGISTGLLISGTLIGITFAYTARFLALSFGTLEAGLAKVTPNMDNASRSLGQSPLATLQRVHVPLLRGSVLTAGLMVFVDGMKELPMTLILRPFNFNTLATHVYEYASYEQFREASPAALSIVLAGLIPVILLSRGISKSRPGLRGKQAMLKSEALLPVGGDD